MEMDFVSMLKRKEPIMAKKIKTEYVDAILEELEANKKDLTEKINSKVADFDAKAKEKRATFIEGQINPLKKEIEEIDVELAKYQKIKNMLG